MPNHIVNEIRLHGTDAALVDDPLTKAKLWALMRGAPSPSPSTI